MKVFPSLVSDETFTFSELASALELVRTQHAITQAHNLVDEGVPGTLQDLIVSGGCPACVYRMHTRQCYLCGIYNDPQPFFTPDAADDAVDSGTEDTESLSSATSATDSTSTPQVPGTPSAVTSVPAIVAATPTTPTQVVPTSRTTPSAVIDHATSGSTLHTSMSASLHWYVITVGRETRVFQGWHNVHAHVVGVPGACFGRYSSRTAADIAYAQALNDGSVSQLPV
ncbi:hypothetical protein BD769DRAFT_1665769 [Suillus cothurnatus]|nr:hypothetical protein BD769DRAFT_1665769 [Suillus cothurnatus]